MVLSDNIKMLPAKIINHYRPHYRTMNGVKVLDDNIYMLDYSYNYDLDDILSHNVKSIGEMLNVVSKQLTFGVNLFKHGKSDFGCTTFNAFTKDGNHLLCRNFDYKIAPCMVLWTHPEKGYKSIAMIDNNFMLYGNVNKPSFTYGNIQSLLAPFACVDGMNEKGLAIAVVEIKAAATNQNTGKTPITTTLMIRKVLDCAATVEEAIELFKSYDMHDSMFCNYHYQISDAEGKTVVLEYVNNDLRVIYPEDRTEYTDKCQYLANYYMSSDGDNAKGFGYDRGEKVEEKIKAVDGVLSEREAMNLLDDVHLDYKHESYPWKVITLWSGVYNLNNRTLDLAAGLDYSTVYRLNVDKPMEVILKV